MCRPRANPPDKCKAHRSAGCRCPRAAGPLRGLSLRHLKTMAPADVDKRPNRVRLSDLEPRFICQRCGTRGVDVRPDFPPARMGTAAC
jgi:hypothetical protein